MFYISKKLNFSLIVLGIFGFNIYSSAQLSYRSAFKDYAQEIKYPFEQKEDSNMEYPQLGTFYDEILEDLVVLQGIKISYTVDYDRYEDQSLTETEKDEDWYINLVVTNVSGEDLYYNNPNDIVATLKIPGERTYYDDVEDKEVKVSGGICQIYAWMLDKQDGKFIMENEMDYDWDFVVNRDTESYLVSWVQRRFRPLEVSTRIPSNIGNMVKNKNDFIAYRETVLSNEIAFSSINGYQMASLSLPKKRVYLSTEFPIINSLHQFKMNGNFIVLHEDNSVRIEVRSIDGYGNMEYRVSNLISQELRMNNNVAIAELTISNSHREEIFLAEKNNFKMQSLGPNQVYTKQFLVRLNPISGEFWIDNDELISRRNIKRNYIPTNLKVRNVMGAKHVSKVEGLDDSKAYIYILYPLNSYGKHQRGMFYFKDGERHIMERGQIYQVEVGQSGHLNWITFDSDFNDFVYPKSKIDKWLGPKPGLMKNNVTELDVQTGSAYYFVLSGDSYLNLESIEKEKWDTFCEDRGMANESVPEIIEL